MFGGAFSVSMFYLIIGATVLRVCCKFLAGGTPDYATATMAVFLAVVAWDGVIVLLYRMPPAFRTADTLTWPIMLQQAAYIGGVTISLLVVPAVVYVWLLEMSLPLATLVFFIPHVLTSAIAIGLALAAIKYLPALF